MTTTTVTDRKTYEAEWQEGEDRIPEIIWRFLAFLFGLAAVLWLVPQAVPVVYLGAALHAARGPRQTIEAFTLLFLLLLGNVTVFPGGGAALRWLVLFAGFGRMLWDSAFGRIHDGAPRTLIGWVLVFFATILVTSLTVSKMPLVSVLKLVSFTVGITTILVCFYRTRHLGVYWQAWFTTFFVFVVLSSLLVFATGGGYLRTAQGFQGIFSHPQVMGPVSATIVSFLMGRLLMQESSSRLVAAACVLGVVFLLAAAARTAGLALCGGLVLAYVVWRLYRRGKVPLAEFVARPAFVLGGIVALGLAAIYYAALINVAVGFIEKDDAGEVGDLYQVFQESRGGRSGSSMDNFREHPLMGIGFGVPSDYERFGHMQTGAFGLPVRASVEKGFMPSAFLEEVGLLGTTLVLVILLLMALPVLRHGSFAIIWLFGATLLINVGEAVFFSMGGLGLFVWLMLGFCYSQAVGAAERELDEDSGGDGTDEWYQA